MNPAPSLRTADAAGIATLAAMSGASFLVLQSFAGAFGIVALTVVKGGVAAGFLAPWLRVPARRAALRRHLGRLFALSLLAGTLPFAQNPGAGAWAGVLALGVLGSGLGWVLHYRLVQRIGAPRAMTVTFLAPLAAMLFEFLVFGHAPAGPAVFGAGLVLAGTALGAGLRARAG